MDKRVFIAIDLPEEIKQEISAILSKLKKDLRFPMRWMEPTNWHLTLTFLGYQSEEDIKLISEKLNLIVSGTEPFEIIFDKIVYGPPARPPRMIWGQVKSPEYGRLKEIIETELIKVGINFQKENRQPNPHLTLARFQQSSKNLPDIKTPLNLNFKVNKIFLMESQLKPSGAEYISLSQFSLSKPH